MEVTMVRLVVAGAPPRAGDPRLGSTNVTDIGATGNATPGAVVGVVVLEGTVVDPRRVERSRSSTLRSPRGARSRKRSFPPSLHAASTRAQARATTAAVRPRFISPLSTAHRWRCCALRVILRIAALATPVSDPPGVF